MQRIVYFISKLQRKLRHEQLRIPHRLGVCRFHGGKLAARPSHAPVSDHAPPAHRLIEGGEPFVPLEDGNKLLQIGVREEQAGEDLAKLSPFFAL